MRMTPSQDLKLFLMSLVVIFTFKIMYNKLCKYLENIHNSAKQYFPNDKCLMLHVMDKRTLQNAKPTNGF